MQHSKDIIKKSVLKIVVISIIVGLNWAGLLAVGETLAYFFDNENSNVNTFRAAILDLSLRSGQNNFVSPAENMEPGNSTSRDIYVGKTANSLPLKHNVSYSFIDGNEDFCGQLQLKIWYNHYFGPVSGGYTNRDMRLKYDGPLNSLTDLTDVDFIIPHPDDQFDTNPGDGTEQWFYYNIVMPGGINDSYQGESCHFNFVFKGWQDNIANYSDGGFTDIEEIENTIKAGYWNPPVVLNEFLPNAGNYLEFIELYNKTASPIDLNGFYIKANGNTIPINATTTSAYSSGSTTIPTNGWLVVTTGGDILNDTSGTVTLYNQNDVEVDSYTYDASDYNVNNTPGWTNNLVAYWPFDNDLLDQSGNSNNGTNNGAIFTTGKINQALSFDGVDDYVEVPHSSSLNISGSEITLEAWIKANALPSLGERWQILGKADAYALQVAGGSGGKARVWLGPLTAYVQTDDPEISTGVWYHLVGVYNDSSVKIYINGDLKKEVSKTGNQATSTNNLIIGARIPGGYFNGLIGEVKIYSRALDATEISEHYSDVGSSGAVPLDKSYARIPDGADNWVDPIPTPGGPNILESEIINQEEVIEEEPIIEEPIAEELPVEETPVAEEEEIITEGGTEEEIAIEGTTEEISEDSVEETTEEITEDVVDEGVEEEPIVEEPPITEEGPVVEEEPPVEEVATEEGGIIEEINEMIDEVIEEIVDEIMPDETINEPAEETVIEEPAVEDLVIEEAPVVDEQPATVPDNSSSTPDVAGESISVGESISDSGVDAGGESVSE